ncbi:ROK family protein [Aestuariimicrobium soli]|uniref:ROK family protein n=1 Tax=Aestuariimicrobium soli TaxID=2035834 RepID=UPI003EBB0D70
MSSGVHPISQEAALLERLRLVGPASRPTLEQDTGLGRKVVHERVALLADLGLVAEGTLGQSTGGRMPRLLEFAGGPGVVAMAEMNVDSVTVGVADLRGEILTQLEHPLSLGEGPDRTVAALADALRDVAATVDRPLWGVGVGVLAPVDVEAGTVFGGHLFDGTVMEGWDGLAVRRRLADELGVAVWVDNEVNLMMLGELRAGLARGRQNALFVKTGPSIGAGIALRGSLQRGGSAAGEVGHLRVPDEDDLPCWCGNTCCLAAFLAPEQLAREQAAGDDWDTVLRRAGVRLGRVVASVVTLLDPTLVVLGGTLVEAGSPVVDLVRGEVERRAFVTAQRDLEVTVSPLSDRAGLVGAAFLAADALFSPDALAAWLPLGTPAALGVGLHDVLARRS